MNSSDMLRTLRERQGLTQEDLARKALVSRQAVSRWETGETVPGVETLKLLSGIFDVSINTLLGQPRKLVCQCCGMPMEDDGLLSREPDGSINETYCKWCYDGGKFVYSSLEDLVEYLSKTFSSPQWPEEAARDYYREHLPELEHWKP